MTTTRISQVGPASALDIALTAHRATPKPATPFKAVLYASPVAALDGAESALHPSPKGDIPAVVVRSGTAGATPLSTGIADAVRATSSIEDALARRSQEVMFHLSLQMRVQDANHPHSALSNTLPARHATVKNDSGNVR